MATDHGDRAAAERRAFGLALVGALSAKGVSQRGLADRLRITQGAVNGWCSGLSECPHRVAFQVERELELPPGHLTQHLGYVPVDGKSTASVSFERTVLDDPALSDQMKRALLSFYRTATEPDPARPGRRPRRPAAA